MFYFNFVLPTWPILTKLYLIIINSKASEKSAIQKNRSVLIYESPRQMKFERTLLRQMTILDVIALFQFTFSWKSISAWVIRLIFLAVLTTVTPVTSRGDVGPFTVYLGWTPRFLLRVLLGCAMSERLSGELKWKNARFDIARLFLDNKTTFWKNVL